jgi:hypothetical protein
MLAFLDIRICTSVWQSQVPETAAKHKHMKKKKKKKKRAALQNIHAGLFGYTHMYICVAITGS